MNVEAQEWIKQQLGELDGAYRAEGRKLAEAAFNEGVHLSMTGAEAFDALEAWVRDRLSGLGVQPELVERYVGVTCQAFVERSKEISAHANFDGGNA